MVISEVLQTFPGPAYPLRGWRSLTMEFTGRYIYIYIYICMYVYSSIHMICENRYVKQIGRFFVYSYYFEMNVQHWCLFFHLFDTPFQNLPYGHVF